MVDAPLNLNLEASFLLQCFPLLTDYFYKCAILSVFCISGFALYKSHACKLHCPSVFIVSVFTFWFSLSLV